MTPPTLFKRAALWAVSTLGRLQRRAGRRLPRYADFWRRAAGHAAYALSGERFVRCDVARSLPPLSPITWSTRQVADHRERYVGAAPSAQNAVDIFEGEWSSKLPDRLGVRAGEFLLFEDPRLRWALDAVGGVAGKDILELGPLEAGHTHMLAQAGATRITAIEANVRAFLKCLVVKELLKLQNADFLCGDFVEFLEISAARYDVVLACGVLYHMRQPVRFIEMLSRVSPTLVLFTHFYDEALIRSNPRATVLFAETVDMAAGGFSCTVHRYDYPQNATSSLSFSGGSARHSYWMEKADIIDALRHFGYRRIETSHEDLHHQNGPGFALVACRS